MDSRRSLINVVVVVANRLLQGIAGCRTLRMSPTGGSLCLDRCPYDLAVWSKDWTKEMSCSFVRQHLYLQRSYHEGHNWTINSSNDVVRYTIVVVPKWKSDFAPISCVVA